MDKIKHVFGHHDASDKYSSHGQAPLPDVVVGSGSGSGSGGSNEPRASVSSRTAPQSQSYPAQTQPAPPRSSQPTQHTPAHTHTQTQTPRRDDTFGAPPTTDHHHQHDHSTTPTSAFDLSAVGAALASEDHTTLAPVVQETRHHHETEEVTRVKQVDRHVHHVQHHVQPLIDHTPVRETHSTHEHPIKYTRETSSAEADPEMWALLQATGPRHEEKHVCYDRVTVEKGVEVREVVHYHVHNIIQPVIYRDRPVPSTCHRASLDASRQGLESGSGGGAARGAWGASSLEREVLQGKRMGMSKPSERAGAATVEGQQQQRASHAVGGLGQGSGHVQSVSHGQTTQSQAPLPGSIGTAA